MLKISLVLTALMSSFLCHAGSLTVMLSSKEGKPLANAVVYLESSSSASSYSGKDVAIMDQVNRQFSPYILPVQKGQSVAFPNSDSIKHHVYSFSPAKVFELQLYKGVTAKSVIFDKSGIVELGCNVHDWMLGYIFVADNPYFAQTDKKGNATIEAPDGEYKLKVWHSRVAEQDKEKAMTVKLAGKQSANIQLSEALAEDTAYYEEEQDEFSAYE
ncbi:methylamine utilization protein [Paraneptunicella aestuarii]|uniref:methylamine utilization protein n=1 Tax=Paraneptunicella aestuarii TaxID=2831148 RepID=UPI001E523ACB|nr:methylamine utilization protein [Paraneptunicella aestuarii]UAA39840.1 methylamine utilization protein [Paraneptunicella aestuarii]